MAFDASKAIPVSSPRDDPRFLDTFVGVEQADVLLAGVPYDVSVLGRKGARGGPAGIREAFRFLALGNPDGSPLQAKLHDAGDVAGLSDDVAATHDVVAAAVESLFAMQRPVVLLGGDHGLTYAHVAALAKHHPGRIGILVIDAHYDLRPHTDQPTSGTPFRRILDAGLVAPSDLVEIGIRPFANSPQLVQYADEAGVCVFSMDDVAQSGITAVVDEALAQLEHVDHLWLSIDIDGFDQSIASGCSAPGAGGLTYLQGAAVVRAASRDPRIRGMDLLEVAPNLDPTGNTCRTAAQLVAEFVAGLTSARRGD